MSSTRLANQPRNRLAALLMAVMLLLGSAGWSTVAYSDSGLDSSFGPTRNMWIDRVVLRTVPTSGDAWSRLAEDARGSWGTADISNQDSDHDVLTLAGALYSVRMNDTAMRSRVVAAIEAAIGTERGGRTLALGRNLTAYVLAADIVGYDSSQFRGWLSGVRSTELDGRTLIDTHEKRPNNWGSHAGAARIAVDLFIGDTTDLDRAARVFRGFLGDRSAYTGFDYGDSEWQANPSAPVPINPAGATKSGVSVDGAIVDDIRRCECRVSSPAPRENYQWEGMQGIVTQATLLGNAGFSDVWSWSDAAVRRATEFLYEQADFAAQGDDTFVLFLIDAGLGTSYSAGVRANMGKSIAYTDVTHPTGSRGTARSVIIPGTLTGITPRATPPMRYEPVTQTRLFDTRTGESPSGRLAAGATLDVVVAGSAGIPDSGVGAVVLNVTATNAQDAGYVTIWPSGDPRPPTSSLNVAGPDEVVPNLVIVPLGEDGRISFYTHGAVDLVADVSGYFVEVDDTQAGRFVAVDGSRSVDTRDGGGPIAANSTLTAQIAGRGGIPESGAAVAVLNVTAIGRGARGFITAHPHGQPRPFASSVNVDGAGSVRSNLVFAPLGADGQVDFFTSSEVHLLADVVGYITDDSAARSSEGLFVATNSVRHVDTRFRLPDGARRLGATDDVAFELGGVSNVPSSGVDAVLANVTATDAGNGYLTLWPTGEDRPSTSSVNIDQRSMTRSNAVVVPLGSGRRVSVYSHGEAHVLIDVFGYFVG